MTVLCVSTSSSITSAALFVDHELVAGGARGAHLAASRVVIALVDEIMEKANLKLDSIDGFVADSGPGSFTGVKVGVSLIKAWGFALGTEVAGISAFDLIGGQCVAIPIRKNYFAIKRDGVINFGPSEDCEGCEGYGFKDEWAKVPDASHLKAFLGRLMWVSPMNLKPDYLVEPSISVAKNPLIMGKGQRGD